MEDSPWQKCWYSLDWCTDLMKFLPEYEQGLFCRYKESHSKIYMEWNSPVTAKTILTKKNKLRGIIPPNIKAYYITIVIKRVGNGGGQGYIDQCNETKNPARNLCKYTQQVLKKLYKQSNKGMVFSSRKGARTSRHWQKKKKKNLT